MKPNKLHSFILLVGVSFFINSCKKEAVTLTDCFLASETDTGSTGDKTVTYTYSEGALSRINIEIQGNNVYYEQVTTSSNGEIVQIVNSTGESINFSYNDDDLITDINTFNSNSVETAAVHYTYDLNDRLIQSQMFILSVGALVPSAHTIYHYGSSEEHSPISSEAYNDLSGTVLVSTNALVYDTHKAVYTGNRSPQLSIHNLLKSTTTDANGNVTNTTTFTYVYNSADFPVKATYSSIGTSSNPLDGTTSYSYTCH